DELREPVRVVRLARVLLVERQGPRRPVGYREREAGRGARRREHELPRARRGGGPQHAPRAGDVHLPHPPPRRAGAPPGARGGAGYGLVRAARCTPASAPANARASEAESSSEAETCGTSATGGVRPAETGSCPCATSSRSTYDAIDPFAPVTATLTPARTPTT